MRSVRPLTPEQLARLTVERLHAYRRRLLDLEQSVALSDQSPDELAARDPARLYVKEDPAWQQAMRDVLTAIDRASGA